MKNIDLEKIDTYIRGLADESERDQVESLFFNGEDNQYLRKSLEKDWDDFLRDSVTSGVKLDHLLDRVHHIIQKKENLKRQKPLQKLFRVYMKAAGFLLLPLILMGTLLYIYTDKSDKAEADRQAFSTIYAPFGARVAFTLPDSTTGMLNSGSKLTYSLPFNNKRHIVMEGEGWFEVKRDEKHPFEINAGSSTVRVHGTSFNLSAYPSEDYVEVVLEHGKVEFKNIESDKKMMVFPSERLVFQDGNVSKSVSDPEKYNAWTEGNLVFRGDPMAEVARRIERWYNVKVVLGDRELEKYSFRATFQDDKLEDVLRFLSLTSPIRYIITPRKLLDDRTFEKEIITIYLKEL